jgi:hypothetical protein
VVAGVQDDLTGRHPVQPVLERAGEERVLGGEVALEGERHVTGDQQQLARGNVDEMLVEVGGADDRRHDRARMASIRAPGRPARGSNLVRAA